MEIILVVLFVLIMVGVSFLKTRLPTSILFPLSIIIGLAMLVWFWVFREGEIYERILITVLILSGLYTIFRKPLGWNFFDLQELLENELEIKVDSVSDKALKKQLRKIILNNVKYV